MRFGGSNLHRGACVGLVLALLAGAAQAANPPAKKTRRIPLPPEALDLTPPTAPPPVALNDISTTAKVLDSKTYFAAGMAIFFLLFTVQFGVSSLIEERSEGTLARLLAAPVRRSSILVGKLLTSIVLGVVSLTVLVVASLQGVAPGAAAVLALVPLAILIVWSAALAVLGAILTVFVRDVNHFSQLALRVGFFASPVMYPISRMRRRT